MCTRVRTYDLDMNDAAKTEATETIHIHGAALRVYRSNGSDGYHAGSYGYELTRECVTSKDGGYSGRANALAAGRKHAERTAYPRGPIHSLVNQGGGWNEPGKP